MNTVPRPRGGSPVEGGERCDTPVARARDSVERGGRAMSPSVRRGVSDGTPVRQSATRRMTVRGSIPRRSMTRASAARAVE